MTSETPPAETQRVFRGLLLLLPLLGVAAWMLLLRQPEMPYLDGGPGPWITAPLAPRAEARISGTLEATFEHTFTLDGAPGRAELFVRLFETGEVRLNGQPVARSEQPAHWKDMQTAKVGNLLLDGPNVLQVDVRRHAGPPPLSLALRTGGRPLVTTGVDWTVRLVGSTPAPVQLAADRPHRDPARIRPGAIDPAAIRVGTALEASLPALLLMLLVAVVLVAAPRLRPLAQYLAPRKHLEIWGVTGLLTVLWIALYLNNAGRFPLTIGFDARGHLEYIDFLLREGHLPKAGDGWQMYQPPLFYLLCALPLKLLGWTASAPDSSAVWVVRAITFSAGLTQTLLIYAVARQLWPAHPARQRLALLLAAGLPVHLYLFHYASNETVATALSAAVVWAVVRWLRDGSDKNLILVGLLLGLALLAKVTAVLLLVAVVGILLGRAWLVAPSGERVTRASALRAASLVAVVALLVGGWHYGRAALEYGNPLIGNWEPELGFAWWQDPGYRSLADLSDLPTLGLGTTMTEPWFAGFAGTGAGLTSTLFGDALAGGEAELRLGPPWNHTWMAAGYVFVPLWLLLAGIGLVKVCTFLLDHDAVRHSQRSRSLAAAWIFLLGTGALVLAALLYMALKVPSYAQAKAFYGQPALPLFVLLAALGAESAYHFLRRPAARASLVTVLLLVSGWSWAAVWIRPDAPATQVMRGLQLLQATQPDAADQLFERAAAARPDWAEPHLGHYWVATARGETGTPRQAARLALDAAPDHPEALMAMARETRNTDPARAERWLHRAIDLDPTDPRGPALLVDLLLSQRRLPDAINVLRGQLLATPDDSEVHLRLAALYHAAGRVDTARRQLQWLADARPDDPRARQALDALARSPNGDPPS